MAYKYFAIQAYHPNQEKYYWLSPNTTIAEVLQDLKEPEHVKYVNKR